MGRAGLLMIVFACAVVFIVDGVLLVLEYELKGSLVHRGLSTASSLVLRGWQTKGKCSSPGWSEIGFGCFLFALAGLLLLVCWEALLDTEHLIVSYGIAASEV